ncbi:MAG: hypothetical protein IPK99_00550 [Flavobacteriales bacterium]|nr:hypothetical protein [Flavobacteriales bacterium]
MMRLTQSDLDQFGSSYTVLRIGGDCATSIEDFDGNVYEVVRIGDQCWCKEDLRTTHYANGDPIPEVTDQLDWENTTQGAYSAYDNDLGNLAEYGALYNGYAVIGSAECLSKRLARSIRRRVDHPLRSIRRNVRGGWSAQSCRHHTGRDRTLAGTEFRGHQCQRFHRLTRWRAVVNLRSTGYLWILVDKHGAGCRFTLDSQHVQ